MIYNIFNDNNTEEYERAPWVFIKNQGIRDIIGVFMYAIYCIFLLLVGFAPPALGIWGMFHLYLNNEPSVNIGVSIVIWYIFCIFLWIAIYKDSETWTEKISTWIDEWTDKPKIAKEIKQQNMELKLQSEKEKKKVANEAFRQFLLRKEIDKKWKQTEEN